VIKRRVEHEERAPWLLQQDDVKPLVEIEKFSARHGAGIERGVWRDTKWRNSTPGQPTASGWLR
jgi:hypothetical protein